MVWLGLFVPHRSRPERLSEKRRHLMNSTRFCTIGLVLGMVALGLSPVAMADSFGSGANQFEIDFVTISGDATIANGTNIGGNVTFRDPGDYRMGMFEITNDQWGKFQAELSMPVTGSPWDAYDEGAYWTGMDVPTNNVSWYEAAQFVNWLNTNTGHHAAYNFVGTQGSGDYTFEAWGPAEADGGTNLYRHKDAFYFLPTEDEWVKAACWNGIAIQEYATRADEVLYEGDGTNGGWNYNTNTDPFSDEPWAVGSGSEELNGTFDMMGNIWEWSESANSGDPTQHQLRGGCYPVGIQYLGASDFYCAYPSNEDTAFGFRVASDVPEPATMGLLGLGALVTIRRRK
jgi:formylglycine-generating enzyme required for sulfatase activity